MSSRARGIDGFADDFATRFLVSANVFPAKDDPKGRQSCQDSALPKLAHNSSPRHAASDGRYDTSNFSFAAKTNALCRL